LPERNQCPGHKANQVRNEEQLQHAKIGNRSRKQVPNEKEISDKECDRTQKDSKK
jgi:hypothetical protein